MLRKQVEDEIRPRPKEQVRKEWLVKLATQRVY